MQKPVTQKTLFKDYSMKGTSKGIPVHPASSAWAPGPRISCPSFPAEIKEQKIKIHQHATNTLTYRNLKRKFIDYV